MPGCRRERGEAALESGSLRRRSASGRSRGGPRHSESRSGSLLASPGNTQGSGANSVASRKVAGSNDSTRFDHVGDALCILSRRLDLVYQFPSPAIQYRASLAFAGPSLEGFSLGLLAPARSRTQHHAVPRPRSDCSWSFASSALSSSGTARGTHTSSAATLVRAHAKKIYHRQKRYARLEDRHTIHEVGTESLYFSSGVHVADTTSRLLWPWVYRVLFRVAPCPQELWSGHEPALAQPQSQTTAFVNSSDFMPHHA